MASRLVRLESLPSSPPALSFGTHHCLGLFHAVLWRYGGDEGQAICRPQKIENLRIYIYKIKNLPVLVSLATAVIVRHAFIVQVGCVAVMVDIC